jgi:uncharacterized protein (DUF4415 family)
MSAENSRNTLLDESDDAPELGTHFFENARVRVGGKVVREAKDTLAKRGRPPKGSAPKVQQSLRLSPEVLDYFRSTGGGWQARIDEILKAYVAAATSGAEADSFIRTGLSSTMMAGSVLHDASHIAGTHFWVGGVGHEAGHVALDYCREPQAVWNADVVIRKTKTPRKRKPAPSTADAGD